MSEGLKIRLVAIAALFSLTLASGVALDAQDNGTPARSGATKTLTLAQAEMFALQNHPSIAAAGLQNEVAQKRITQARAVYYPTLYGNLTGVAADHGTVLAAGAVQTSSLSSRSAAGLGLNQLVTDFGRTLNLVRSARLEAEAQTQDAADIRARVLLGVRQAYYRVLAATSVQTVARASLENRRLTLRQVSTLAQSNLKSTLDVNFAQVLVSEAELAVYEAESTVHQANAELAAAMGNQSDIDFTLADEPLPPPIHDSVDDAIATALRDRPDLQALTLTGSASHRTAEAEKRLNYPSVSVLGVAGTIPDHDSTLIRDDYSAVGLNIYVPIFNGKLFTARYQEAALRARIDDKNIEILKINIARDVRVAWFEADDSLHRLDVTARLVAQANEALRLAQARYDNGLGSIVELNEAQLNQTYAEIAAASAKYDYLGRRAVLDYTSGGNPLSNTRTRIGEFGFCGRALLYIAAPFLLATVFTGCGNAGLTVGSPTAGAANANEVPVVPVVKVARADLAESIALTGEFQPYQEVDIMAKVSGYLKSIRVDIGDRVREGQLLATLEIPEMENDRTRAAAEVQAADADINTAQQELQQANAAHELAHLSYTRINDVNTKEPGLVPAQEVDVAHSRDLEAEARLGAAKSKLQASQQHKDMALAAQARTETLYKYAQITAPFDAVVTKRYANVGSMIQAGTASQTQAMPVVRLSQNNLLRLILPVPESAVPLIHDGGLVQINVRTLGKTITGRVTRFSKTVDMSTRTMVTEVDVPNPTLVFVPGMYADVVLDTRARAQALSVPIDAVQSGDGGAHSYRVDASGVIHKVAVKIGIQTPMRAEILSGLNEGDTVIVGRLSALQDGQHVQTKVASFETNSPAKAGS